MEFKELKENKVEDLQKTLQSEREKVRALRFSVNSKQEKNVRKMRQARKIIAQVLTILNIKKEDTK